MTRDEIVKRATRNMAVGAVLAFMDAVVTVGCVVTSGLGLGFLICCVLFIVIALLVVWNQIIIWRVS